MTTATRLDALLTELPLKPTSRVLEPGAVLVAQGDVSDALFRVASGQMEVDVGTAEAPRIVNTLGAGALIGEIALVSSGRRSATVRAATRSRVDRWSLAELQDHLRTDPELDRLFVALARERMHAENLVRALTKLVGPIEQDVARDAIDRADWTDLERGDVLFREGDTGDTWYVLVSGRLSVSQHTLQGPELAVASITPGMTVGELAVLAGGPRNATVVATRDSAVARFDASDLHALDARIPTLVRSMATGLLRAQFTREREQQRCTRVAVLEAGAGESPVVAAFLPELLAAAHETCSTRVVHSAELRGFVGGDAGVGSEHPGWMRVAAWLDELETHHSLMLIVVDTLDTALAEVALRVCDRVVWLADATGGPRPTRREAELLARAGETGRLQGHLCLLHPEATSEPRGTPSWLAHRPGVRPHHVRANQPVHTGRLARHLADRPVVMVLGGGGARGFAHLGVARALSDAGIPVDAVCGTSIGAIIGAQIAMELDQDALRALSHRAIAERPFRRPTLPWVSLVSGRGFERMARITFGDRSAEDLWIPYFCTATSLSTGRVLELDTGPLWRLTLASSALPGVLPPIPRDGELLVDGGVLDNLPCERARDRWGGTVVAVVLQARDPFRYDGDRLPSSLKVLAGRLGLARVNKVPFVGRLLAHTVTLGSATAELRSASTADHVVHPSLGHIRLTDLHRFEEVERAGFACARASLQTDDWSDLL